MIKCLSFLNYYILFFVSQCQTTADLWGESVTSPHEIIQSVAFFSLYKKQILVLAYKVYKT